MNILVTGAGGQLGHELRRVSKDSEDHFIFSSMNDDPQNEALFLDVTNEGAVDIICASENIDVIINCAAYTSVDQAETDITMADLVNHQAAENLAKAAKKNNALLIHISTDYVFGGDQCVPYTETDEPAPNGVYGATKLLGDKAVSDSGCRYMIFRTSWLYSSFGHNFVKTIMNLTSKKPSIDVVWDQIGCPTYAADLAEFIYNIIEKRDFDHTGLYNYTNEGVTSWYDFAVAIAELSGSNCKINPCLTEEYPTKARRPHYSVLDKALVKKVFGVSLPYWRDSLQQCLAKLMK